VVVIQAYLFVTLQIYQHNISNRGRKRI